MKLLEVILRTCDIANVHVDWRIRYNNVPKSEMIKRCFNSLVNSCKGIEGIKLTVLDDHSSEETVNYIKSKLNDLDFPTEFISLKEKGYNNSSFHQYVRCVKSDYELVYSIEDDYLHCPTAIQEMIDSYRLFNARITGQQIVLFPFDEPSEYNPPSRQDFIVHGSNRHWRTGIFTTQVLFASPQLFKDHWKLFETIALKYNGDYLKPRAEHFEESNTIWQIWNGGPALRFNPIPSLALHMQFDQQKDPFIDWKFWWDEYGK